MLVYIIRCFRFLHIFVGGGGATCMNFVNSVQSTVSLIFVHPHEFHIFMWTVRTQKSVNQWTYRRWVTISFKTFHLTCAVPSNLPLDYISQFIRIRIKKKKKIAQSQINISTYISQSHSIEMFCICLLIFNIENTNYEMLFFLLLLNIWECNDTPKANCL